MGLRGVVGTPFLRICGLRRRCRSRWGWRCVPHMRSVKLDRPHVLAPTAIRFMVGTTAMRLILIRAHRILPTGSGLRRNKPDAPLFGEAGDGGDFRSLFSPRVHSDIALYVPSRYIPRRYILGQAPSLYYLTYIPSGDIGGLWQEFSYGASAASGVVTSGFRAKQAWSQRCVLIAKAPIGIDPVLRPLMGSPKRKRKKPNRSANLCQRDANVGVRCRHLQILPL